jgi:GT2 family glycosyltransferase
VTSSDATVSVVIPTRDRAGMVGRALGSVAAQTRHDHEIIVVDDGSTDDTAAVVRATGIPVRYVRQDHAGVSAARNRGVSVARGAWVAFLDSDDEWLPRKLERQLAFVAEHPHAQCCQTEELWIRDGRRVNPGRRHRKPSGDIFAASLERCLVSPSAVMIRRRTFERLGGFDEGLAACEDYDLWIRLTIDTPVHLIPEPLAVRYAGHADQLSRRHWGMDRFRIAALLRLLATAPLEMPRRCLVAALVARKCRIVATGARRRGRDEEAQRYEALGRWGAGVLAASSPRG